MLADVYKSWIRKKIASECSGRGFLKSNYNYEDRSIYYASLPDETIIALYEEEQGKLQANEIAKGRQLIQDGKTLLSKYGLTE